MKLTDEQEKALQMVDSFMKSTNSTACIAGYAGVGKSSLMAHLPQHKIIIAPTGKAAVRISELSGIKASTIHRWMYAPKEDKKGDVVFIKKPIEDVPRAPLIIIDEASMIDSKLYSDIIDTADAIGAKTLFVGDPFQLPPVSKEEFGQGFSALSPNLYHSQNYILMTHIVRQALDSPIIRASMLIRNNDVMNGLKEINKLSSKEVIDKAMELGLDTTSIVCHTNTKRFEINNAIRNKMGLSEISSNEQILVTKNNYELDIFNGEVHKVTAVLEKSKSHEMRDIVNQKFIHTPFYLLEINKQDKVVIAETDLTGDLPPITKQLKQKAKLLFGHEYLHANYGYACTAHKMQGSQNQNICIMLEPSVKPTTSEGIRWLYVAVTRATDKCFYSFGSSL